MADDKIDREKLLSIAVKKYSNARDKDEKQLSKDLDAYQRIRRQGIQPRTIDGSAELEGRANNRLEMEMGHLFPSKDEWAKAKEGMARAEEINERIKLEKIENSGA